MSPLYEVVGEVTGWSLIAVGIYTIWRDGRPLFPRIGGRGRHKIADPGMWRKAWHDLRFSPLSVVIGVSWLAHWYKHPLYFWLTGAYIVMLASWDLSAWFRSRKRRKSGGQAAEML
jgi:hypothetical protein